MKTSTKIIIGILAAIALGILLLSFQANQLRSGVGEFSSLLEEEKKTAISKRDEAAMKSSILQLAIAVDEAYANSVPSSKLMEEPGIIQIKESLENRSDRDVEMSFASPENDYVIKMGYIGSPTYYCIDSSTISTPELLVEVESGVNPLTSSTLCDGSTF